jgi:hypothetical protein
MWYIQCFTNAGPLVQLHQVLDILKSCLTVIPVVSLARLSMLSSDRDPCVVLPAEIVTFGSSLERACSSSSRWKLESPSCLREGFVLFRDVNSEPNTWPLNKGRSNGAEATEIPIAGSEKLQRTGKAAV